MPSGDLTWRVSGDKEYATGRGWIRVRPKGMHSGRPVFCPVCSHFMVSHYDSSAYDEFKCCEACSTRWARRRREEWTDGWRPTIEELGQELIRRNALYLDLVRGHDE
jgi:hypothetical protein